MKITIESPRIKVSQKLEKQVRTKFMHLGKIYPRIVSCDVLLRKEKDSKQKYFSAEARLLVPGELLFATEKAETFEIALDKLSDDLAQQLRRHKESWEEAR